MSKLLLEKGYGEEEAAIRRSMSRKAAYDNKKRKKDELRKNRTQKLHRSGKLIDFDDDYLDGDF